MDICANNIPQVDNTIMITKIYDVYIVIDRTLIFETEPNWNQTLKYFFNPEPNRTFIFFTKPCYLGMWPQFMRTSNKPWPKIVLDLKIGPQFTDTVLFDARLNFYEHKIRSRST